MKLDIDNYYLEQAMSNPYENIYLGKRGTHIYYGTMSNRFYYRNYKSYISEVVDVEAL